MSRQTLAQRKGLARYRDVQASADTRTAGQRRADVRAWTKPEHRPLTRINVNQRRRKSDQTTIVGYVAFLAFASVLAAVWHTTWFQGLLEVLRSQP